MKEVAIFGTASQSFSKFGQGVFIVLFHKISTTLKEDSLVLSPATLSEISAQDFFLNKQYIARSPTYVS